MKKEISYKIPEQVLFAVNSLEKEGFEAWLVGGCVRDILLPNKDPEDWDITTNAEPEKITKVFEKLGKKVVYENNFGTVAIVFEELSKNNPVYAIEITPYRTESNYSDNRRPDEVRFAKTLEEDLKRRDFTINALAYNPNRNELVDHYGGIEDIKGKIIRAVGNPEERIAEDALRMMRAVRLMSQLSFTCNEKTIEAIKKSAKKIEKVSVERIRDEFFKLINAKSAKEGLIALHDFGLLQYIVPEIEEGIDIKQNKAHIYDVWTHSINALEHASNKEYKLSVKLAALFHDVAKPRTKRKNKLKGVTFYGHEVVGTRMLKEIMKRLRFPRNLSDEVEALVANHMFFMDTEIITLAAVRRLINRVGKELVWDLIDLRTCDRIGMGRPKEKPYRLRKFTSMIEEAMRDPVSVKMLNIDGNEIMKLLDEKPGPKIGLILDSLMEEVLDDPKLNTKKYLKGRAKESAKLDIAELQILAEKGKEKQEEEERGVLSKIRKKYNVK